MVVNSPKSHDNELIESIKMAVAPQMGKSHVGAIVAIYVNGHEHYLSFGETVRGNKQAPDADTLFEIGSLTKTFTGLLMASLVEEGKLKEEDSLDHFKNEWAGQKAGSIMLKELVSHSSGLPRLPCNSHFKRKENPYADYSEKDLVESLKDSSFNWRCRLEKRPVSTFTYSNWGFTLLGYVLEKSQNKTYEALLKEKVLGPLNLRNTSITLSAEAKKRRAQGYTQRLTPTPFWEHQISYGAGALMSSASDMIKYARALLHPETTPLEKSLRRSTRILVKLKPNDIAYAWFKRPSGNFWHDGTTGGFRSFLKIYPEKDMAIVYLTNTARPLDDFLEVVENE